MYKSAGHGKTPIIVKDFNDARMAAVQIGYPLIVCPRFCHGGHGGGIVHTIEELETLTKTGLDASLVREVMLEESSGHV